MMSSHIAESGTKIFLRIFELSPTVRDVFNYHGPEDDPESIAKNPRLAYHALAFMHALDDAVKVCMIVQRAVRKLMPLLLCQHHTCCMPYHETTDKFSANPII